MAKERDSLDVISDKEIIRKILSEKESDVLEKEKLYRILYEASAVDEVSMDTDLIDECIKAINLIEGKEEYLSEEKMKTMRQNVDQAYKEWQSSQHKTLVGKRIAQVAAAFILIFFTSSTVASALGYNLFQSVVNWGKDTFNLSTQSQPVEEGNSNVAEMKTYSSIQEVIKDIPVKPLLPQWVPEGFVFKYGETFKLQNHSKALLYFQEDSGKVIVFDLSIYVEGEQAVADTNFEKDENLVEVYEKDNIKHYILRNLGQTQAIWSHNNTVYNISGDISADELIKIVDSMN
ncbi:uncharacterized protein DUF4367 [Desulfitobacterium sp. LBE]|uniref:DUF4367 domain-containing protein n=3 Tax=root TaxID=1 RepID=Q24U50_DESHY|nr:MULTISPECIES: DUF4367 domain-containing protein [Desulfitobacterium]KTE90157.1 hypothetical protein AT727_09525 [Desulfitobacterium hafniense]MEA5022452.1 DUF4367 domain-containing protein [Desulfitobacterium hafniense]TWH60394.1 uncharacterized protein DUF4367 [Desulfitobacterium sp. LBE]CDX02752.1 Protein of unknown function (DUF4367) [Desulfitobacterium hafniense]BAE84442.1 hypothetical protein DSY2653 [Desulfitobacterium hafniense Y51]